MGKIKVNTVITVTNNEFSPFSLSVGDILRKEALVVLTYLSQLVTEKLNKPTSYVRGWVNGWTAILIARF